MRAPQPPVVSPSSLISETEKIIHLTPNTNRKEIEQNDNLDIAGATPSLESEEDDTGTILYRSPGYPTISSELPIKERPVPFSSTRIFTHSPMTGITRLRRYDVEEEEQSGKRMVQEEPRARKLFVEEPNIGKFTGENLKEKRFTLEEKISKSPPVPPPRAEYLGNSQSSRCPHCTIHTWLPHSP